MAVASAAPPPAAVATAGEYASGEKVYYTARCATFPDGSQVAYGQEGVVAGPAPADDGGGGGWLVQFKGSRGGGAVECRADSISRVHPGPLPGAYELGESVYFLGPSHTFANGDSIVHGRAGDVVGPATGRWRGFGVAVQFPGNKAVISCKLDELSRNPPAEGLPGGYAVGDRVYFTGPAHTFASGNKHTPGEQGQVVGPVLVGPSKGGLAVLFPTNSAAVACRLEHVSRHPPTTPPGDAKTAIGVLNLPPRDAGDAAAATLLITPRAGGTTTPRRRQGGPDSTRALRTQKSDRFVYLSMYEPAPVPTTVPAVLRARDALVKALAAAGRGVTEEEIDGLEEACDWVLTGERVSEGKQLVAGLWALPASRCTLGGLSIYALLNDIVRSDDAALLEATLPLIKALNCNWVLRGFTTGPSKWPAAWPVEHRTFRGSGIPEEALRFFEDLEEPYRVKMYLSTSASEQVAMRFARAGASNGRAPVLFSVHVEATRRCAHVNYLPGEAGEPGDAEFLFPPYSVFTVRSLPAKGPDGVWRVEIDAAHNHEEFDHPLPVCSWH